MDKNTKKWIYLFLLSGIWGSSYILIKKMGHLKMRSKTIFLTKVNSLWALMLLISIMMDIQI